jgi:hypothetical protein
VRARQSSAAAQALQAGIPVRCAATVLGTSGRLRRRGTGKSSRDYTLRDGVRARQELRTLATQYVPVSVIIRGRPRERRRRCAAMRRRQILKITTRRTADRSIMAGTLSVLVTR